MSWLDRNLLGLQAHGGSLTCVLGGFGFGVMLNESHPPQYGELLARGLLWPRADLLRKSPRLFSRKHRWPKFAR